MNQLRRHHISFRHAIDGIIIAVTTQPNFKIHLFFSLLTIYGGFFFRIASYEWLILALVITVGLGFELVNTAIEYVVDLLTKEYRLEAKYAKDTAAAAMLVYAIGGSVVAALIFIPKILVWLFF